MLKRKGRAYHEGSCYTQSGVKASTKRFQKNPAGDFFYIFFLVPEGTLLFSAAEREEKDRLVCSSDPLKP